MATLEGVKVPIPDVTIMDWAFPTGSSGRLSTTPVMIDANRPDTHSLSLHSWRHMSKRLACGLKSRLPSDEKPVVVLFSKQNLAFPIVFMGVAMIGGSVVSRLACRTATILARRLQFMHFSAIFVSQDSLQTVCDAADIIAFPRNKIYLLGDVKDAMEDTREQNCQDVTSSGLNARPFLSWTDVLASDETADKYTWDNLETVGGSSAQLTYEFTSGTLTGTPKVVVHTHKSFVASANGILHRYMLDKRVKTHGGVRFIDCFPSVSGGLRARPLSFLVLPAIGIQCFYMEPYSFENCLKNIEKFRITDVHARVAFLSEIAKRSKEYFDKFDLSSVVNVMAGGELISGDMKRRITQIWPTNGTNFYAQMGMRETHGLLFHDQLTTGNDTSTGSLLPNFELKVMDVTTGEDLPVGKKGEILLRGPAVGKCYINADGNTSPLIGPDGWFHTGDYGQINDNYTCTIIGRKNDLIEIPEVFHLVEIESELSIHPGVHNVGIAPIMKNNAKLCVFLELKEPNVDPTNDITATIRRLGFKGDIFCITVEALPRHMEKLDRRELRIWAESRL